MTDERFQPMPVEDLRDYLVMVRALISQGAVDVDEPSQEMSDWARWAVRSNDGVLTAAVAKLAEGSALARRERYIEVQLIAPASAVDAPVVDFEVADRFRLLRLVSVDHRQFAIHGLDVSVDGAAGVLFSSFAAASSAANALSIEADFADLPWPLLLYACVYHPVLPADFLDEGADPLSPARDFLKDLTEAERSAVLSHVHPDVLTIGVRTAPHCRSQGARARPSWYLGAWRRTRVFARSWSNSLLKTTTIGARRATALKLRMPPG